MAGKVKTRFAPSPTGMVHIGSAYSALLDYAFAKKHQGEFLLRIEDTDRKREVKGAEKAIVDGLNWLGLNPSRKLIRQSARLTIYQEKARELIKKGKAYYCFCSESRLKQLREEQKKNKQPPMYDKHCRAIDPQEAEKRIKRGEKAVIRMKVPEREEIKVNDLIRGEIVFHSATIDDQVLLKSDGYPTYHLAVVVDDYLMNITHVIRGEEWLPSFPKHQLLYQYFGWPMPVFLHTPTLRNPDKSKLSKRQGHTALSWYQEQGFLPEALVNFLCLLGWSHPQEKEIFSLKEFIKFFDLRDVSPAGPIFDLTKLEWMNGEYIRKKTDQQLADLLVPFLPRMKKDQLLLAAPLIKERIKTLAEARELLEFVWQRVSYEKKLLLPGGLKAKQAKEMLEKAREIIKQTGIKNTTSLQEKLLGLIKENGWRTGAFFMVLRVAICGKKITPPILESLSLIGEKEVLARIGSALAKLA